MSLMLSNHEATGTWADGRRVTTLDSRICRPSLSTHCSVGYLLEAPYPQFSDILTAASSKLRSRV